MLKMRVFPGARIALMSGMSMSPETDFDLEKLFLPAWAQEPPSAVRYAKYTGNEGKERKFDDRPGGRRPRRDEGGRGPRRDANRGPRGERPESGRRPGPGPGRGPRRDDRGDRSDRGRRDERTEPMVPLPELNVTLMPDDRGVDSLSHQIKVSGRSFPLFDIAQMILKKPERQQVRFEIKKKPDGQPAQPLFLCAIDDSLWTSEEEAVTHALARHFNTFYQTEKTPTDPPKGTYTFVAQCGMSGVILGPPNYHDYQNQLRKLHVERFSRMPFDVFKSRVKIVKEEAVVKKWIEEQSFKTEYVALNVPDALRLPNREEVEKHFRQVHLPNIIKQVEKHTITGPASRNLRSPGLQRLVRHAWDEQKRFPLKIATILSQQFAAHGLQFFKVNKTITHVSVARPHFLDLETTPVSDQVKKIVEFINAHPKTTRRKLIEALAPSPTVIPVAPTTEPAKGEAATPPPEPQPTPEQASLIGDLHWLIHQGHVIEFANGTLETAKKPVPKPPKPQKAQPAPTETPLATSEVENTGGAANLLAPTGGEGKGEGTLAAAPEAPADATVEPVASVIEQAVQPAATTTTEAAAEPPHAPAAT